MKKDNKKPITPPHLGGHNNKTWEDHGALECLIKNYNIKSFLDIGCGPGKMLAVAKELNLFHLGIDGDPLFKDHQDIQLHDFTLGPITKLKRYPPTNHYDLGWSVEFLEHVEAQYIPNFMAAFKLCKYVVITHATPKQGGFHHVNEQWIDYWIKVFSEHGFKVSAKMTQSIRENSTMRRKMVDFSYEFVDDEVICHKVKKSFMEKNGWVFVNQALI